MKRTWLDDGIVFEDDKLHAPESVRTSIVISSVKVQPEHYGYDVLTIYNRGAGAGDLRVRVGDGEEIARRLMTPSNQ